MSNRSESLLNFEKNRDSASDYVESFIDALVQDKASQGVPGIAKPGRAEVPPEHLEPMLAVVDDTYLSELRGVIGQRLSNDQRDEVFGCDPLFIEGNPTAIKVIALDESFSGQKILSLKFYYPDGKNPIGARVELVIDAQHPRNLMNNVYRSSYQDGGEFRVIGDRVQLSYEQLQEFVDLCAYIASSETNY